MSTEKAEGLILRVTDFSETSRIVVLFTREFGKISALAKGGRRLKGPFESALDLLATCQIVFIKKNTSGLDLLTEAKLIRRFHPPEHDLTCLYGGYYVAELILGLTEDYDPSPPLYDLAQSTLTSLGNGPSARLAIIRFEISLLREIGQLPDFDVCVGCGASLKEGQIFGFWGSQGGLICPHCQHEEYRQTPVHAGTAAILRILADEDDEKWRRLSLSPQQFQETKQVTISAISHTLGHRPKMLKYLG